MYTSNCNNVVIEKSKMSNTNKLAKFKFPLLSDTAHELKKICWTLMKNIFFIHVQYLKTMEI